MRHGKGYIDLTEAELRALAAFTARSDEMWAMSIHFGAGWALATDRMRLACLGAFDASTHIASIAHGEELTALIELASLSGCGRVRIGRLKKGRVIKSIGAPPVLLKMTSALAPTAGHPGCAHRWSLDPALIRPLKLIRASVDAEIDTAEGFLWHAPASELDPIRITLGQWSISVMPMRHPDNKQAAEERGRR